VPSVNSLIVFEIHPQLSLVPTPPRYSIEGAGTNFKRIRAYLVKVFSPQSSAAFGALDHQELHLEYAEFGLARVCSWNRPHQGEFSAPLICS
jgi:hypothetical protein